MSNRLLFVEPARLDPRPLFATPSIPSWTTIRKAWGRYRTRQRIAYLDSHLLQDIGVSFADAEAEANKPFWRA